MSKGIFVFFLCSFLAFGCKDENKKPGLFIARKVINLNEIKFDSTYTISYSLVNTGNEALLIDTASSSCDCTVPVIGKKNVLPGDSTFLTVMYKPVDTGFFNKKVVIKSNIDSVFSVVSFTGKAVK